MRFLIVFLLTVAFASSKLAIGAIDTTDKVPEGYWLAITFCLAAADNTKRCEMRTVPQISNRPLNGMLDCQLLAAGIMRLDPAYRLPILCTRHRPSFPMIPATTAPGRWS